MYSTTNWPLSPLDVLMDQNILEQHNIRIQAFDIKACTSIGKNPAQIHNEMQSTFYTVSQFVIHAPYSVKEYAYLLHHTTHYICIDCTCNVYKLL